MGSDAAGKSEILDSDASVIIAIDFRDAEPLFCGWKRDLLGNRSLPQRSTRKPVGIEVLVISKDFSIDYTEITCWGIIKANPSHPEKRTHGSDACSVLSL